MSKYSLIKILFCMHVEKVHRYVFDKIYQQDYDINIMDRFVLIYYGIIIKIVRGFRPYLRHWKYILNRAYNQKRVSLLNFYIYHRLKKINTERYSAYFNL